MRSHQDPNLLKAFAAELKARRDALKFNQDDLAFAAGVNRTFVAKIEVAKSSPSLSSLFRIARGLEVEPWELVLAVQERYEKEGSA
jgi:transcriptional regulator with XRE-family HTH domain